MRPALIEEGCFAGSTKLGKAWGEGTTVKAVWHIVKESARTIGVAKLAPHLRRTRARLCHASGGELEQIQFLLRHISVQTTERYLMQGDCRDGYGAGPNQDIRNPLLSIDAIISVVTMRAGLIVAE